MAAAALLAIALAATVGIQSAAASALQQTLNDHWRGAYDILVTADPPTTDGLLQPGALAGQAKRMPLSAVEKVRDLDGVDVAAPLSTVIFPATGSYSSLRFVADIDAAQTTRAARAYRMNVVFTTDDGLGERLVSSTTYRVSLDTSAAPREIAPPSGWTDYSASSCPIGDLSVPCAEMNDQSAFIFQRTPAWVETVPDQASVPQGASSGASGGGFDGDQIVVDIRDAPGTPTRVALVDPEAERALLGRSGDFLAPLVDLGEGKTHAIDDIAAWASASPASPYATEVARIKASNDKQRDSFFSSAGYQHYLTLKKASGNAPQSQSQLLPEMRYLPMIVAANAPARAPLHLTISVDDLGPTTIPDEWTDGTFVPGEAGTPLPPISVDASKLLQPFNLDPVTIPWYGSTSPQSSTSDWWGGWMQSIGHPKPWKAKNTDGVRSVDAVGYTLGAGGVGWAGDPATWIYSAGGTYRGNQSAFTSVESEGVSTKDQPLALPIATFDPTAVTKGADAASYVPLGAYDDAPVQLVADAAGKAVKPITLNPTVGALGLAGARTDAVADLGAFAKSLSAPPVDAIRVRVAGVHGYDTDGIRRVTDVAQRIQRLGYTATIVAGSSRSATDIAVKGWAFGTMDSGADQKVGPLGTVVQDWTRLGAAAGLSLAVSQTTSGLVWTVLAALIALYAIVSLSGMLAMRREATVLRSAGWSRARVARWRLGDHVPAVALVAGVGAAAVAFAPQRALATTAVITAVAAMAVIAVVAAVIGSRARRSRMASASQLHSRPSVIHLDETNIEDRDLGEARLAETDEPSREAQRSRGRRSIGASSPAGFGVRLIRSDLGGAGLRAASILIVVTTIGAVAALLSARPRPSSLLHTVGTAAVWAPQLTLAVAGVVAAVVLAVFADARRRSARALDVEALREHGWTTVEIGRAQRVELLATGIPVALIAAYALWFALDGTDADVTTSVSWALAGGLVAVAALDILPRLRAKAALRKERS
ncbi:hypothetical protein [Glaciibacter flavus]|uniref:hypothetical protein n=1 Tax=Orlajensenia flava TaxID=2565934 RepID=UPI003B006A2C